MSQTVLKKDDGCWNNTLDGRNRYIFSTLPKLFLCTAWLFTRKISVQIQKKQQTWQESALGLRRFPAQNMLSSSSWSYALGALHCFCEISLTLASSSWWDISSAGCTPKKKRVTFLPVLLHVDFVQNTSLLAISMGKGKSREGCMV